MNVKLISLGIIALGIVGFAAFQLVGKSEPSDNQPQPTMSPVQIEASPTLPPTVMPEANTDSANEQSFAGEMSEYTDGTYTATGAYIAPPGEERITVTVVLEDDVVTDSSVVKLGKHEISKKMQTNFESGYKEFVIGRNINEIDLDVVAGSSLTPNGFENALEQIKQQARS